MFLVGDKVEVSGRQFRIDGAFPNDLHLTEVGTCEGCGEREGHEFEGMGTSTRYLCTECVTSACAVTSLRVALERIVEGDNTLSVAFEVLADADAAGMRLGVPYVDHTSASIDSVMGLRADQVRSELQSTFDRVVRYYAR